MRNNDDGRAEGVRNGSASASTAGMRIFVMLVGMITSYMHNER